MKKIVFLIILFVVQCSFGQILTDNERMLNQYAQNNPRIIEPSKIQLSNAQLDDYIRTLGVNHEINVYVAPELSTEIVTTNFYDIPVKDVFLFLIKEFDLVMSVNNQIISFKKRPPVIPVVEPKKEKPIDVTYNKQNDFLSVKLKNDSLPRVAQKITDVSGKNVVLAQDIKTEKVSAYMLNRPFDQVMDMLAKSNDLIVTRDENGFYYLEKNKAPKETKGTTGRGGKSTKKNVKSGAEIEIGDNGYIKINANEAAAEALIREAADKVKANFIFYNKPDNVKSSLTSNAMTFDELLDHVLKGSEYTFKKKDDLYIIGKKDVEGLRIRELIQLENRTVETVMQSLPKSITDKVEMKEFLELNGIMVSGSRPNIDEIKDYINQLDKIVPLVQIEVMIVQYQKSHAVQTGLKAILDKQNGQSQQTGGQVFPSTDASGAIISSSSINNLINAFNGFGLFKIGKVTKDFYLNLTALENNAIIKTESTPNIATLSGHEASVSIGETSYYFEQNNNILNTGINNTITQSGRWEPTEANLSLKIKPSVSKDEHVTLEITVENSRFLGRVGEGAPPGKATQNFKSLIRVRNGEMVMLGGLNESNNENSGTGTPLLSRIPVIKWFFSSKTKSKSKSKLHVFIKPTVIY